MTIRNNYQLGQIALHEIEKLNYKPTILVHVCCGACSTYPLELLNNYFFVTILYTNSNIYPFSEYLKRLAALKKYVDIFNKNNNSNIIIIESPYNNNELMNLLKYRKDDEEKGPRCKLCYFKRLKETFEYAIENHYDYVTTVMTMSRQKDEQAINRIGKILEEKYQHEVKFLIYNFKKKGGQERRDLLVEKYNIYDQKYCGCVYSLTKKR